VKIVFFGTPKPAVTILDKLHKEFAGAQSKSVISAVVTQEPKPAGRKKILRYSAVDDWAHKRNIPIFFDPRDLIKNNIEATLGISASFGQIIPLDVINYFPKKIINIHFSLLPKWRGASPVPATIISGEKEAGVSTFLIDEKLDHGPILTQFSEDINSEDTSESLIDKLFSRSAGVLIEVIPPYLSGKVKAKPQNHDDVTYTKIMQKEDGFIPTEILTSAVEGQSYKGVWEMNFLPDFQLENPGPIEVERFIRAMTPWPTAWTDIRISVDSEKLQRIKILNSHIGDGKLILDNVQLEGKNAVSWQQFKDGYKTATFE
jgi:methionyl-tRNA formyltransferase